MGILNDLINILSIFQKCDCPNTIVSWFASVARQDWRIGKRDCMGRDKEALFCGAAYHWGGFLNSKRCSHLHSSFTITMTWYSIKHSPSNFSILFSCPDPFHRVSLEAWPYIEWPPICDNHYCYHIYFLLWLISLHVYQLEQFFGHFWFNDFILSDALSLPSQCLASEPSFNFAIIILGSFLGTGNFTSKNS